jgi:ElaB/YqjD/DUF883 family membrane-anchored ribosome-binding protein
MDPLPSAMDHLAPTAPDPKVGAVIANIVQLMDEAEAMLRDSTSQHAEPQVALMRDGHDGYPSKLSALLAETGPAIMRGARRTDQAIRRHPYQAIFVALGAGLALGLVAGRRKV